MSGLAWLGRALFGGSGGAVEGAGSAAQHGAASLAAAHGGALNAAAVSGVERATPPRQAAPAALLPLQTTPWAARSLAQTPPAGARLAAAAPARRDLLTGNVAAGAEPEAPDLQAQKTPLSSPRASPRLAERGGKPQDAGKAPAAAAAAAPRDASGVPRAVQQLRKKHGEPAVSSDWRRVRVFATRAARKRQRLPQCTHTGVRARRAGPGGDARAYWRRSATKSAKVGYG